MTDAEMTDAATSDTATVETSGPAGPDGGADAGGLDRFHPAVRRWFHGRFDAPTAPQRRGWPAIASGRHTLIAAPTGSGKTLAAFLHALDGLLREGIRRDGTLPEETRVLYVSPLKALSADIHRNLAEPRKGIRRIARETGLPDVKITAAVRSGDTPRSARRRMVERPPNVLVTTPESLYLLLTAERSREILASVRTVIVDEIHAVLESRRGSHLALSLERLDHVTGGPLQRIGLSATQKPIREVGRFLVGAGGSPDAGGRSRLEPDPDIVDEGHLRELDLDLELPGSPLEAVMSTEVRGEVHDRLAELISGHRTTLVFVNTRREAERVARALADRLGGEAVTAHHGSLSKETRLEAERRLEAGDLRGLVATASMELGIDIGHVDLACQLGSPNRIATFLQRVGRSGHTLRATPKGRLFPQSRDDLVECASLLRAARRGELDRIEPLTAPLDVLSQQIVAEVASEEWDTGELHRLFRRAWPYRSLERETFDRVVEMVSGGAPARRGRRSALVHHDRVNGRIRGRRGSRMFALTCGGAIPDNADYRVVLEPAGTYLGSVNEDFAVESLPGDVFQLGNASWRVKKVETGVMRVEDARGEPPSMPFWFGEAPARQIAEYLGASRAALGTLPTTDTVVLERFFDESGGMQLVLHAPFGSRVNRAWGLVLRKRFCRKFDFELQAAATEDAVLLSLAPQHSFPLEEISAYLHPDTVEDVLVQAVLDAPMFRTRWRWCATLSLVLKRWRGGSKVPPQIQRMEAEDLLSAVFPDATACLENVAGEREVPDHPLVGQTLRDCLEVVMDLPGLRRALERIREGDLAVEARDTTEPSPLSHEVLNARPYAFLDDAPLEERRAQAVRTRRTLDPEDAREMGGLDPGAIARVREEAFPPVEAVDELHEALMIAGYLRREEAEAGWEDWMDALAADGRAARIAPSGAEEGQRPPGEAWVAAERLAEARGAWPGASVEPDVAPPDGGGEPEGRPEAVRELLRSRLQVRGPVTAPELAGEGGWPSAEVEGALRSLESEGVVLRGHFRPEEEELQWCDRGLLARIHRYTLKDLRERIRPVEPADFMRFLFGWQRAAGGRQQAAGREGLAAVLRQLEGLELPAVAWETEVLPLRVEEYEPELLDRLCASGRIAWGRVSPPGGDGSGLRSSGPLRTSPVALWRRRSPAPWLTGRPEPGRDGLSSEAVGVLETLEERGASFFDDLVPASGLLPTRLERALGELVAHGLVTSDGFDGLRALITPADRRRRPAGRRRGGDDARGDRDDGGADTGRRSLRESPYGVDTAGRWSRLGSDDGERSDDAGATGGPEAAEAWARALLRRYGVVFRKLLEREGATPPWRALLRVYRRLEARGEIRGGRFVAGFSGQQFALPEAVGRLRSARDEEPDGDLRAVSAADPLNLTGIVTPGRRIPAVPSNRVAYRDGIPAWALEGGELRPLQGADGAEPGAVRRRLVRKPVPPAVRPYAGTSG